MKFLVYGSRGWIGQMVVRCLTQAGDEVVCGKPWIQGFQETLDEITAVAPDRIVCCTGRRTGPGCKTIDFLDRKDVLLENIRANLSVPMFACLAARFKRQPKDVIPVLVFSSTYIFNYDEEHPVGGPGFTEKDRANFKGNNYTIVKSSFEMLLEAFNHVITARIGEPVGPEHHFKDFLTTILQSEKITTIPTSYTILEDIVPVLLASLAEKKAGFLNACNPGAIDAEKIIKMYEDVEGLKHSCSIIYDQDELAKVTAKRSNCFMETGKIQRWISELSPELKQKYGVLGTLRPVEERMVEIVQGRKGTLQAEYTDLNEYDNIIYSGPDAPSVEHQMRIKARRAKKKAAQEQKEKEQAAAEAVVEPKELAA